MRTRKMSFAEAIRTCFRKYANFQGRARRSEYWKFMAFQVLFLIFIMGVGIVSVMHADEYDYLNDVIEGISSLLAVIIFYNLATLLPLLAVTCRRLHDTDRSGAYMLFPLIPVVGWIFAFIWLISDGDPYPNRYGADPKRRDLREKNSVDSRNAFEITDIMRSETVIYNNMAQKKTDITTDTAQKKIEREQENTPEKTSGTVQKTPASKLTIRMGGKTKKTA